MEISRERLGLMFILIGPGGVGKNALMNLVVEMTDNLRQLPTATTRPIRDYETPGLQHDFVSVEQFEQMIANGELIEWQEVYPGKYYGVPRKTVESFIQEKRDVIADIEVFGAAILREQYPEHSTAIFIAPPSVEALRSRLENRGASNPDIIDRLKRMPMEMLYAPICDYFLVNDNKDAAASELRGIVDAIRGGAEIPKPVIDRVDYTVNVTVVCGAQVLVRKDAATDLTTIQQNFEPGRRPEPVALDMLANVPGLNVEADRLAYRKLDGGLQVECVYDREASFYGLTYYFVYEMDAPVEPSQGWQWVNP